MQTRRTLPWMWVLWLWTCGVWSVPPGSARAEVEGVEASSGTGALDEARTFFDEQRYHKASIAAYEVLSKPCSAATSAEARWLLGRSLDIIGLPQLATLYYRDVVRFGRTAGDVAGDALVAWADAAVRLDDTQELVARLEALPFDPLLPDAPGEAYIYLDGVARWEARAFDVARLLFEEVGDVDTLVGWQATYLLAAMDVAGGARDAAYNRLVPLSRGRPPLPDTGNQHLEVLAARLHDLALLAMARIQYAAGEFEDARVLYERVPDDSEQWPRASLELAWTLFHLGRLEDAVGVLARIRLDRVDRVDREAFVPEASLLVALIYMWTEQFDLADGVLRAYLDRLHALRTALRDFQEAYRRVEDAPRVMALLYDQTPVLALDGDSEATPAPAGRDPRETMARRRLPLLRPIAEDLRRNREVAAVLRRVENTRTDVENLGRQMAWWQETDLCTHLRSLLVREERDAIFDAGRMVQAALERWRLRLGELDVLALAYRREVTLQRLHTATEDDYPHYQGEPLPPFDFVRP